MEQVTFDKALQKRLVEEWISDLRKPGMKQTKEALERLDGSQCCLGVACRTYERAHPGCFKIEPYRGVQLSFGNNVSSLPDAVMTALGLRDPWGSMAETALYRVNDSGATFPAIADIIEREWNDRKPGGLFLTDEELAARP